MLLLTDMGTMVAENAPSVIPSHDIAAWVMRGVNHVLHWIDLDGNSSAQETLYVVAITIIALAIGMILLRGLLGFTRKMVSLRHGSVASEILRERLLAKCFHVIPPLVFMALIPFAFNRHSLVLRDITMWVEIYLIVTFTIGLNAVLLFCFNRYDERVNTRNLPLKGILNVVTGIIWIITLIVCVSILVHKSPAALLAGLGAFAAALMLIFKNSILGCVAGIQLSENDMLHVGDWIVVPGTPANGIVTYVSLTTVKVRNWDNTVVTVPPYNLISNSFQNWRGMSDSGVRRILQSFPLDPGSVHPCTPKMLADIAARYPVLNGYIQKLQADTSAGQWTVGTGLRPVNGTTETNLGLFRAYLVLYLSSNPHISADQRILVQVLEPTADGIPMQIWCFTNTTDFNAYSAIQAAVTEHITSAMADFGLGLLAAATDQVEVHQGPPAAV